jgi:hypothetical protein
VSELAVQNERQRRFKSRSIQLADEQWDWLDARAERTYSRSASAEIRQLVAAAMEEEARSAASAVAAAA